MPRERSGSPAWSPAAIPCTMRVKRRGCDRRDEAVRQNHALHEECEMSRSCRARFLERRLAVAADQPGQTHHLPRDRSDCAYGASRTILLPPPNGSSTSDLGLLQPADRGFLESDAAVARAASSRRAIALDDLRGHRRGTGRAAQTWLRSLAGGARRRRRRLRLADRRRGWPGGPADPRAELRVPERELRRRSSARRAPRPVRRHRREAVPIARSRTAAARCRAVRMRSHASRI